MSDEQPPLPLRICALGSLRLWMPEPAAVRDSQAPMDSLYWTRLWPSAEALTRVMLKEATEPGHVLELGAGLGLPGLSLAHKFPSIRVLLTDVAPAAVDLLERNIAQNGLANARAKCLKLEAVTDALLATVNTVLVADLAYEPALHSALYELIERLLVQGKTLWMALPERLPSRLFLGGLTRPATQQWPVRVAHDFGHTEVLVLKW